MTRQLNPQYLSISCLPLPTYVQSGHVTFEPGNRHPNREHFQFFVMMFIVRGILYIAEDDCKYTVKAGEMFILQPNHHHYSWKPMDETTEYYWVHFSVTGHYLQADHQEVLQPVIDVPSQHRYTPNETLYLAKHTRLQNIKGACSMVAKIIQSSATQNSIGFWQAQEVFLDLLQQIQAPPATASATTILANEIQRYLRDHFDEKITNQNLGDVFHVHPNAVTASMRKTFGITPNLYLTKYRLEEAAKRLLSTPKQISQIAEEVGYQNVYYFSMTFKRYYGVSPLMYRKQCVERQKQNI